MSRNYANIPPRGEQRYKKNNHSSKSGYFVLLLLLIIGITCYYVFSRGIFVANTRSTLPPHENKPNSNPAPKKPRFEFYTLLSQETVPVPRDKNSPASANAVAADATTSTQPPPVPTQKNEKSEVNDNDIVSQKTEQANQTNSTTAPTGVPAVSVLAPTQHAAQPTTQKQTPPPAPQQSKANTPSVTTESTPPPTATVTSGRYVLQVAALQHPNDVDQLKAKLTFLGFNVSVEPFPRGNDTWYRIKVGPFLSQEAMQKARQVLVNNRLSSIVITLPSASK